MKNRVAILWLIVSITIGPSHAVARIYEIYPATVDTEEEFEKLANALQPGDELILHGGTYSQKERRAVTAKGTAEHPIIIRAAIGEVPLLTRPADRQNNIEFVDCTHLVIRGLRFQGGNSGVRFIRGHHVAIEDCEIFETGNNALTMNSGDCHAFIVRRNHIHHTGLSTSRPTEGEGMYIGCHSGSCRTTDSLIEGNYIHHTRGTSDGGNDGIEIKFGSHGNIVRHNVIHDTNIGRKYPGIFVYGGGPGTNVVDGNVIWNAGEGIQVVSDASVRNNIIFDCAATGITAAPHAAVPRVRNAAIINNTIFNTPVGVRMRWVNATNMVLANNAIYCANTTAMDASIGSAVLRNNYAHGGLNGLAVDGLQVFDGGDPAAAFANAPRQNFWPRSGSLLIGHGDPSFTSALDFNELKRTAPFDVGAYESDGRVANPGWTIQAGFKRQRGVAKVEETRPKHFPHRIWAACDFESRTPDYGWFGPAETNNLPRYPGNATALGVGARPYQNFSAIMTGINPVPGPRMGKVNYLYLRYYLAGGTEATFQHFSLTSNDNNHIRMAGLTEGNWSEVTMNFTRDARRNDGTPGTPFKEGERMDDLKIFVGKPRDGKRYDLAIDDVIFFANDPDLPPEPEPFPNRVILLAAFDTGPKERYWPGEFEIVEKDLPTNSNWRVARAVPRKDGRGKWIRLQIDPVRAVGAHTKLRFRYHVTGTRKMTVQIFDLTDMDNRHIHLRDLKAGQWQTPYLDFTKDARRNDGNNTPFAAGHKVDDLFFFVEPDGGEPVDLLIDEVVLFDAGQKTDETK